MQFKNIFSYICIKLILEVQNKLITSNFWYGFGETEVFPTTFFCTFCLLLRHYKYIQSVQFSSSVASDSATPRTYLFKNQINLKQKKSQLEDIQELHTKQQKHILDAGTELHKLDAASCTLLERLSPGPPWEIVRQNCEDIFYDEGDTYWTSCELLFCFSF